MNKTERKNQSPLRPGRGHRMECFIVYAPFIAVLRFAQDDRQCFYIFAHIQLCCNMIGLLRKQCFEYTETVGADIIRPLYAGQFSELRIIGD